MKRHTETVAGPLLAALTALVLSACGSSGQPVGAQGPSGAQGTPTVLPIRSNPIHNGSTARGLSISKVLVENNISPTTGKAAPDHIEVTLKNSTNKPVGNLGLYYKVSDPRTGDTEGYFTKLTGVSIAAGGSSTVHFDNMPGRGHFPDNKYSLYRTDKNALVINVEASTPGLKPASFTVHKDSGGAEAGVE
jgi:hypothetical protein